MLSLIFKHLFSKEKEARELAKKLAESNLAEERLRKELSKELEDWKSKYVNLEKRGEQGRIDLESAKVESIKMKETIKNLEIEIEKLKTSNRIAVEEKTALQKKLDIFLNEKNEMSLELARGLELQQKLSSLQSELQASATENNRIKDDLSKWKLATSKIESEWSKKCMETEQFLSNEANKLRKDYEEKLAKMTSQMKTNELHAEEKLSTLNRELERVKTQSVEYQEKIRSFVIESEQTSQHIKTFEERVALLSCEIQRLKHQNSEYEGRSGLISDEVGRLNKIISDYEERIALLSCELERHKFQATDHREKNNTLTNEVERLKELQIKFEDKAALLSCEIERLKNKEFELHSDIKTLNSLVEEKELKYKNLLKEKENNDNFQTQRISSLSSEIDRISAALQSKSKEEEVLKMEVNDKQSIIEEKEYWKEQFSNSERKVKYQMEKAEEEKNKYESEKEQLRVERDEAKSRNISLEVSIGEILRERESNEKNLLTKTKIHNTQKFLKIFFNQMHFFFIIKN